MAGIIHGKETRNDSRTWKLMKPLRSSLVLNLVSKAVLGV